MSLHPSLREPGALEALQARWQEEGNIRVEPFLSEPLAEQLHTAFREQTFSVQTPPPGPLNYQYYSYFFVPEPDCDHVLCSFGRWLFEEGAAWIAELTGLTLGPPEDRQLMATLYSRGCYLDPHNDADGQRSVAYVVGLTRESWPAERGGHLEFLEPDGERVRVTQRRSPGWNTLDLFDVRDGSGPRTRIHRIPIVQDAVERRVLAGWLYER